jgi:hypothetical protein
LLDEAEQSVAMSAAMVDGVLIPAMALAITWGGDKNAIDEITAEIMEHTHLYSCQR